MKKMMIEIINIFFKIFKVKENKLLFETGRGKVDCAPRAIYEYIKNNCNDEFKTMWLVTKEMDVSSLRDGDYCYYGTFKALYHQATSKYWIRSQSIGGILKKKKNQIYLQFWHGCGALKKGGYQVTGEKNMPTMDHAKEWDYLLVPDEKMLEHLVEAVSFKKKTYVIGKAENDSNYTITEDEKDKIRKKLGISKDEKRKIVLYAPTFREKYIENNITDIKLNKLSELDNILLMINGHPLMSKALKNSGFDKKFIDAIDYPDIHDLYKISDVLITDYSGTLFEFIFYKKMVLLYPFDFEEYSEGRNGFTFDYMNYLPFPKAFNEDELFDILKNIDKHIEEHKDNIEKFYNIYHKNSDGHVCERVINMIRNKEFKTEEENENKTID